MKRCAVVCFIWLVSTAALSEDQTRPRVVINVPNAAKINKPFLVKLFLSTPSKEPVTVTMDDTSDVHFSERSFKLKGAQQKSLTAILKSSPPSGIAWIFADADGYDDGWGAIDFNFAGHLKPSWSEPLTSDGPTTLSFMIVDKDGQSSPSEGNFDLVLQTADGILDGSTEAKPLILEVPPGSRVTPQFRLQPRSGLGGNVHLTAILKIPDYTSVLAQEQFVFPAHPEWWVPVLLAISGGLLHAVYKIVRMPLPTHRVDWLYRSAVIVVTSCIAAFVGYLFADFDLLGLKLDPNVLRTYPILGFLFSYLGIEGLLSDKLSHITTQGTLPVRVHGTDGAKARKEDAQTKDHLPAASDVG